MLQIYLQGEPMSKVLFAWIGNTDIKASQEQIHGALGPTAEAILQRSHTDAFLLSDHTAEDTQKYRAWLADITKAKVTIKQVKLSDPMDFNAIYHAAREQILNVQEQSGKDTDLVFNVSPGTPAMAAVWILLAKACFPQAELIGTGQRDETTGKFLMRTISVPFDISIDPIADIIAKRDNNLARALRGLVPEAPEFNEIIHKCAAMKIAIAHARKFAPQNVPVLLTGETGTGKELMARAIHTVSKRKGCFVPVNCGAISPTLIESELFGHVEGAFTGAVSERMGLFEYANNGTLFLDEIGDLSSELQVKLLRVIQEGQIQRVGDNETHPVNVRIISATHRNLMDEIGKGRFREDLFHRIVVGLVEIPPLRKRKEDMGDLIDFLLSKLDYKSSDQQNSYKASLSAGARSLLMQYDWPGNVRELKNVLTRAAIHASGSAIDERDIEDALIVVKPKAKADILNRPLGNGLDINALCDEVAKHYIQLALAESGGNKTKAAKLLGLTNPTTLNNWMKGKIVKAVLSGD
jgi:DNA-binding NtrC family response regulator